MPSQLLVRKQSCPPQAIHISLWDPGWELPVVGTLSKFNGRYQPSLYRRLPCGGVANNLLAALIDNHIHHGNELGIDSRRIAETGEVGADDHQLRHIVDGLQGKTNRVPQ